MSLRAFNLLRRKFYSLTPKPVAEREITEELRTLKLKQQKFQKNDGLPVFLKGEAFDKILFVTTMGLAGLGVVSSFGFIYVYANPKKLKQVAATETE
jgi:hypothetical protein